MRHFASPALWQAYAKLPENVRALADKNYAPGLGHLPALLPDEIVDAGLSSLSRIERADSLVDFRAQGAQLFDMREQCPPDLLLILGGQALYFGNGLFKRFDHDGSIANRSPQNSKSLPSPSPFAGRVAR